VLKTVENAVAVAVPLGLDRAAGGRRHLILDVSVDTVAVIVSAILDACMEARSPANIGRWDAYISGAEITVVAGRRRSHLLRVAAPTAAQPDRAQIEIGRGTRNTILRTAAGAVGDVANVLALIRTTEAHPRVRWQ
jgi:hypothetical protein